MPVPRHAAKPLPLSSLALCRYNLFIILYPLGVIGELMTIYAALPFVRRSGMYSMRLPNKYNVSFDYYYCLIIVMLSYIPCKEPCFLELAVKLRSVYDETMVTAIYLYIVGNLQVLLILCLKVKMGIY